MHHIHIQQAADKAASLSSHYLNKWARAALKDAAQEETEVTIRVVNEDEMTQLNSQFRHKAAPTNVLSFPFATHEAVRLTRPILGDIVICAQVVNQEAMQAKQDLHAHWAHMVVHGILHLLGYDHQTDNEAKEMEVLEIKVLQQLGFSNPYQDEQENIEHE